MKIYCRLYWAILPSEQLALAATSVERPRQADDNFETCGKATPERHLFVLPPWDFATVLLRNFHA
jgi:hypothetical protein